MDILTLTANQYMNLFSGFMQKFLFWGQWIFLSLFSLNVVWLCLWYAFDFESFLSSMSDFIKRLFVAGFFYTLMVHPNWLLNLLRTSKAMGQQLTGIPIDPASIVMNGLSIANRIIAPMATSPIFDLNFSLLMGLIAYVVVLFAFISIAVELTLILILATAQIAISPFFLSFAALGVTHNIARLTLDSIFAQCMKLLGIYLVVGAGGKTLQAITSTLNQTMDFDANVWIVATTWLFWALTKKLPQQLAHIVTGAWSTSP